MRRSTAWVLASLLLTAPSVVVAQTVRGTLVETGSERPIVLGHIVLLDTAYAVVEQTITDHEGRFVLVAPSPGSYWIVADRVGYQPVADGILELGENGFLPITFYMRPRPILLEGLSVTARRERIVEKLTAAGFYDRRESGFGHFIGPEEIEQRPPHDVPDLLRRAPGVRFDARGVHGDVLYFRARGPRAGAADAMVPQGYCRPLVYVDGVRMTTAPSHVDDDGLGIEIPIRELVDVDAIVAAEVLQGAAVPLQWGGSEGNCGVVLFWTEGGRRPE